MKITFAIDLVITENAEDLLMKMSASYFEHIE